MSENTQTTTVSVREIKKQFNTLGGLFLFQIVFMVLFNYLGSILLSKFPLPLPWFEEPAATVLIKITGFVLAYFIPALLAARMVKTAVRPMFQKCRLSLNRLGQMSVLVIALHLLVSFVVSILILYLQTMGITLVTTSYLLNDNWVNNIMCTLMMIIIMPIGEEFLFRGLALKVFSRFGAHFSLFASAVFYALMQGNLSQAVPALFIGYALALVTLRYKSLYPAIFIHMAIHLVSLSLQLVPPALNWIIGLVSVLFYAGALVILYLNRDHRIIIKKENHEGHLWKILVRSNLIIIFVILSVILIINNVKF